MASHRNAILSRGMRTLDTPAQRRFSADRPRPLGIVAATSQYPPNGACRVRHVHRGFSGAHGQKRQRAVVVAGVLADARFTQGNTKATRSREANRKAATKKMILNNFIICAIYSAKTFYDALYVLLS